MKNTPKATSGNKKAAVVLVLTLAAIGGLVFYRLHNSNESYGNKSSAAQLRGAQQESQLPAMTAQLLNKAHSLKGATPEERTAIIAELKTIAKSRYDLMKQALNDNPGAIVRNTLPKGLKAQLPAEVQSYLETEQKYSGTFEWAIEEDLEKNTHANVYNVIDSSGRRHEMKLSKEPSIESGSKIDVYGALLEGQLAAATESITVTSEATLLGTSAVPRKVAVILLNISGYTNTLNYTPDQAKTTVFSGTNSANAYFQEASYGRISLGGALNPDGDVFGPYTISALATCDNTGQNDLATKANNVAAANGLVASNYNHIVYVFPNSPQCAFSGRAIINGSKVWINSSLTMGTVVHELGHNLGLYHAHRLDCAGVSLCSNGSIMEYGHSVSIMGYAGNDRHFDANSKERIGWLNVGGAPPITTVSSSGTYTIAPMSSANSTVPRVLKIRKANGMSYHVEFRQPTGFDYVLSYQYPGSNLTKGVVISLDSDTDGNNNQQLDMNPGTTTFYDSALLPGLSYTDSAAGLTITTVSAGPDGATVQVTFGSVSNTCTNYAPSLAISPATQTGAAGSTMTYTFTMQNIDSSSCTSSTYTVNPTLPAGWYMTPSSYTETLAPGASVTRTFNVTSAATAVGSNTFNLTATSTANSGLTKSASAIYTVNIIPPPPTGDTTPPTLSFTSPVNGSTLPSKGQLKINATATDASGIATITISLDGTVIKTCSAVSICAAAANPKTLSPGTHTITAVAIDNSAAKNSSGPVSVSVIK